MRIDNLDRESIGRIKAGDIQYLKALLVDELGGVKEDLINLPLERVEELRGRGKVLLGIIKLLP